MAVTQAICNIFKLNLLQGGHDFTTNTFMIALYDRLTANLDATTTAYTSDGEITGSGYTAGGLQISPLSGYPQANALNAAQIDLRFDDVDWIYSTFSAGAGLIYNADFSNAAVAVLDFGTNFSVSNGTFSLTFPTNIAATLILR